MTWTTQLTYAAAALSAADTAALAEVLGQADVSYDAGSNRLQITVAVEAATMQEATGVGLSTTAVATGLAAAPQEEAFDRYWCRRWRDVTDSSERDLGDGLPSSTRPPIAAP